MNDQIRRYAMSFGAVQGYLVHHDMPSVARSNRTHVVHATCHRSEHSPRRAGNTVLLQTT